MVQGEAGHRLLSRAPHVSLSQSQTLSTISENKSHPIKKRPDRKGNAKCGVIFYIITSGVISFSEAYGEYTPAFQAVANDA